MRIARTINLNRFSFACSLAALCGHALAQTWIDAGPGIIENGNVEGMAAQNYPVYGAVETLAIHPTDPNVILLGSVNGGVWKTSNATASNPNWQPVTDFLPSLSIGALAFDHADSSTIFAGIGNYSSFFRIGGNQVGVFVSHDTGVTWAPVPGNPPLYNSGINVSSIVANGPLIFVATDGALTQQFSDTGVYRSTDGGATFQHLSGSAPGLPNLAVSSFVADPTNANRFYAGSFYSDAPDGHGIFRTEDAGATWSRVTNAAIDALLSTVRNIRLAVNDNGTLFAGIVDADQNGAQLAGIFRSQNHGATFDDFGIPTTIEGDPTIPFGIHNEGQGVKNFSFLAHPTNDDILFVGGDAQPFYLNFPNSVGARRRDGRLFRSTAPGAWTSLTHSGTASNSAPHADSRAMAFDLGGNVMEVDDGGVYRRSAPTTNVGDWTSAGGTAATGIGVTEMYSVAYDNHGHVVLAGTQDNGTIEQTTAGTRAWSQIYAGDSGAVRVFDPSPTADSFRYSSNELLRQFERREFSPLGVQVGPAIYPALHVVGSADKTLSDVSGTRFDANVFVNTTLAVNRVNPGWLVFGTNSLYETTDHAENVVALGGVTSAGGAPQFNDAIDNDGDGTIDEADEMRPQLIFDDTVRAVAYGGFKNGIGFPDVLYASAGGELRIRRAGGGFGTVPSLNSAFTAAAGPGALIRALTLAQSDWETAFVGDIGQAGGTGDRVFRTFDGGVSWSQIPGLYPMDGGFLRALAEVETGSIRALFAGARNGVFWTLDDGSGFGPWSEFGAGSLPNAPVRELEYDPIDDLLVVGTLGRGAWEVPAVSAYLIIPEPDATVLLLSGSALMSACRRRKRPLD